MLHEPLVESRQHELTCRREGQYALMTAMLKCLQVFQPYATLVSSTSRKEMSEDGISAYQDDMFVRRLPAVHHAYCYAHRMLGWLDFLSFGCENFLIFSMRSRTNRTKREKGGDTWT